MSRDDDSTFEFSLDDDADEYDPWADDEDEEGGADEGDFESQMGDSPYTAPKAVTDVPHAPGAPEHVEDTRTPEERTNDLLKEMAPRRKTLLGILSFCLESKPVEETNAKIDELQKNSFSVYTPANLCTLLERAGAIERIDENDEPVTDEENEPEVVEVEGVEYLQPAQPKQVFWRTTAAGKAALDADKPLERLNELLESDQKYAVIYKRILTLCDNDTGTVIATINKHVDNDPLLKQPRMYASRFVDRLERCDALEWKDKAWHITDVGRTALELLADVEDEAEEEDEGDGKSES